MLILVGFRLDSSIWMLDVSPIPEVPVLFPRRATAARRWRRRAVPGGLLGVIWVTPSRLVTYSRFYIFRHKLAQQTNSQSNLFQNKFILFWNNFLIVLAIQKNCLETKKFCSGTRKQLLGLERWFNCQQSERLLTFANLTGRCWGHPCNLAKLSHQLLSPQIFCLGPKVAQQIGQMCNLSNLFQNNFFRNNFLIVPAIQKICSRKKILF